MDDQTKADIQKHFKKLKDQMIEKIDENIERQVQQFKKDIINIIDQETKTWSKKIYDQAWQKGNNHF